MTHDVFEDELRAHLRGATEAESSAFLDIDTDSVLDSGHRVLRRRRVAIVGGTAALATVVSLGTWAALGGTSDRAVQEVPATRATAPATGSVTALLDEFSGLSAADGSTLQIPGPRRVAVRLSPGRTPDLEYLEVGPDGSTSLMGGSSLDGLGPLASTWGTAGVGSHVLVGVLPAGAVQFQLLTPIPEEGGHPSTSVRAPLPGTSRQAFAVRFADPSDADATQHLLWWGEDRVVHDESGAVVPSVALGDSEGTTVFVSRALGRFGTFSDSGGSITMGLDAARNTSGRPVLSTGRGTGDRIDGLFAALVPRGARPGALTPAPGATVTSALTATPVPGTDLTVMWSRFSYPGSDPGTGYRSVTWTEDGRTVTELP